MTKNPIVFVHELSMHTGTCNPWMQFVTKSKTNTKTLANHGVKEIAEGYAKIIGIPPSRPIPIDHSFIAIILQLVLRRCIATAKWRYQVKHRLKAADPDIYHDNPEVAPGQDVKNSGNILQLLAIFFEKGKPKTL
jgi:hypothetical protein